MDILLSELLHSEYMFPMESWERRPSQQTAEGDRFPMLVRCDLRVPLVRNSPAQSARVVVQ